MILPTDVKEAKLRKLLAIEGYASFEELAEAVVGDSVSPAICIECDATAEMEPDQDAGYCETCGRNTVVSALVLAGIV